MSQRVVLAQEQLQLAQSSPAMHNMYEAYKRVYEALGVKDIEQILKNTDSNTPTDPMSENLLASKAVDGVVELKAFIEQDHDAHIAVHQLYMQTAVVQQQPKIALVLEKHIYEHISMKAQIMAKESVNQVQGEVPVAQYEAQLARIQSQLMMEYQQQNPPAQQQGEQDPLVQLKQQELQLRQQDLQAKQQLAQAELQLDQQQLAMKEQDQQADRMMDQEKLNLDREKFEQDKINKSVGG